LAKIHPWEDSDFTVKKFEEVFNADLANGIGNLTARVARLCEISKASFDSNTNLQLTTKVQKNLNIYRFDLAIKDVWERISKNDKLIDKNKIWDKTEKKIDILTTIVNSIRQIAFDLQPFLPSTADAIAAQFNKEKIKSGEPLFPRL